MVKRFLAPLGAKFKGFAPNLIQVAAMVTFCAGFFVLSVALGLIVSGIMLGIVGWAVDSE